MRCNRVVAKKVTESFEAEFTHDDIINALRDAGHKVPVDAEVFVRVPGGGDWSNMNLDLMDAPVIVTWKNSY